MVELMVALVVGLVVGLAALNNAQVFGNVGRSQAGGGTAVASGAAAIGAMKFELQMAGLGFFSDATALCPTLNLQVNGLKVADNAAFQAARVNRMADGTDQLEVVYGTAVNAGAGSRSMSPMPAAMGTTTLNLGSGIAADQAVMFASPSLALPCTVATVSSAVDGASFKTVQFNTVARFNPANWAATFAVVPNYQDNSWVSPLGDVVWRRYYVRDDALYMLDVFTNVESLIAEGIVKIRAQYGLAANATSTSVAAWQDAVANAPLAPALQQRLRAVRLGLVAVNTQRERPQASSVCDSTLVSPEIWPGEVVDLTARSGWQCFRYRTMYTVVGTRNMQWGLTP